MSHAFHSPRRGGPGVVPHAPLDAEAVRAAYRRWAGVYDFVFGGVSAMGRRRAVALVNNLPGKHVLEVGVGTGLALPHYRPEKRITGSISRPRCWPRLATGPKTCSSIMSRGCTRWMPRRWTCRTGPSTSRSPCSWPPSSPIP